jgi:hypothetical protein
MCSAEAGAACLARPGGSGNRRFRLRSHAQSALEFDGQREPLEETGWIQIVLTRFVDHTDEIVFRCIWVVHDRV